MTNYNESRNLYGLVEKNEKMTNNTEQLENNDTKMKTTTMITT